MGLDPMAVNYFKAQDSFRDIFLNDGGNIVAPSSVIAAPTGAGVTITTNQFINRNSPAGPVTAAVLAAGAFDGQVVVVTNESTVVANTITFNTAVATGLVLTDATPDANVIKASNGSLFLWLASLNGGNGAWIKIGSFGG